MPGRYGDDPNGGQFQGVHIPRAGPGGGAYGGNVIAYGPGMDHHTPQRRVSMNVNPNYQGGYTINVACCDSGFNCLNVMKIFIAEMLATAMLLFLGCSGMTIMPITFGVAIAATTQIFGDISGAHINPAVTVAALIMGRIENVFLVPIYVIAQFVGGLAGYGLHYAILELEYSQFDALCTLRPPSGSGNHTLDNLGFTKSTLLDSQGNLFGMELLMTFIYIMAVCAMWDHAERDGGDNTMPLKRGLFYTGITLCFYYMMGAQLGLNPVRAIVPLIYNSNDTALAEGGSQYGHWDAHWIYWIGPLVGSLIGALIYRGMVELHKKTKKSNY